MFEGEGSGNSKVSWHNKSFIREQIILRQQEMILYEDRSLKDVKIYIIIFYCLSEKFIKSFDEFDLLQG